MNHDDGLPNLFRLSTAAEVLGVQHGTLRRWADTAVIATVQTGPNGWRMVSRAELERFATILKVAPKWEFALD